MTNRSVFLILEQYQQARWTFIQGIANLAQKEHNIPALEKSDVLHLLKPLINDGSPQIRQCAAIALSRMIQHGKDTATTVINEDILSLLLESSKQENKYQKKSTLLVLRALCRTDPQIAQTVVDRGALFKFVECLEDFDASVKESAAWAIGCVARHKLKLAQLCVDAGVVPLLILCLQESEIPVKQVASGALADIAKHSIELAQNIVDSGVIPHLTKNLSHEDEKLKRQTLTCLSACAKHSAELAECVAEAEIFPAVLLHLCHPCALVRRDAACLIKDIVKHTLELTQLVVNTGGIGALMEVLNLKQEESLVPCITALGYIGGHSDQLALTVLTCKAVVILGQILNESHDNDVLAVTIWTLGQLGKHSPEHSHAIAVANIFPRLVELYVSPNSSEDVKFKSRLSLKLCLHKCLLFSALEPMLYDAPPEILKYILGQYSKVLPHDPKARRMFVATGGLKKVQEIDAKPGSTLMEYITVINSCFPEEIVRYYSPGYPETLLDKVEQYSPQMMAVLHETNVIADGAQTDDASALDESDDSEIFNDLVTKPT